jgi:hypothetical protein
LLIVRVASLPTQIRAGEGRPANGQAYAAESKSSVPLRPRTLVFLATPHAARSMSNVAIS